MRLFIYVSLLSLALSARAAVFPYVNITGSGGLTNASLTASRLTVTDANKKVTSVSSTGLVDGTGSAVTVGSGLSFSGGTLSATGGGSQTPWTSDINGADFSLTNVSTIVSATNLSVATILFSPSTSGAATNHGFYMTHSSTLFDTNQAPDEVFGLMYNAREAGRVFTNDYGFGFGFEGNYHPVGGGTLLEFHLPRMIDLAGVDNRIGSWTIAPSDTNNWVHANRISQDTWYWPKTDISWLTVAPGSIGIAKFATNASTTYMTMNMDGGGNYFIHTAPAGGSTSLYLNDAATVFLPGCSATTATWDMGANININGTHAYELKNGLNNNSMLMYQQKMQMEAAFSFGWTASTEAFDSKDTGLARDSAGVVRVTDGGSGTKHLKVNLMATGSAAGTISSAGTITVTNRISFVSGTTTITNITAPSPISGTGGQITLIPTGAWATGTGGNIAIATTAVTSKALTMTYDAGTTAWYPSY